MKEILIFWALGSLVGDLLAERSPLIQQATFWSTNFENIFTWDHGRETSPGTVYDVQYKTYGAVWQNKSECQNITQHFCNLTRETESYTERYYARVRAVVPDCCVSKWIKSLRFCPKEDTVVGEPEVKYIPNIRSIKFIIQPPYTPLRDEDNQTLTVEDIFSQFDVIRYQIIIFCENTQQKWKKTENNKEFEISELDPGTEYNGTIHIKYLGKISKPRKFRVKTLPDNLWMPYLFGVVAFMALLIFGTIYYLIYKYIKRFTTQQPMSLNFKDMSRFQPLTLTVEHILMSHDINKSFQMDPEMKPEQIIQHLQEVLEHQKVFDLPERVYQQQAAMASIHCVATPIGQADKAITIGYAPQVTQNKPPHTLDDKRSTLTYGICVEGTSHSNKINSSTSNMTKSDSVVEGSIGNGHTKVQKGKQHKRGLWESLAQKKPAPELERAEEIQQLLLQGDTKGRPQQLPSFLQERVPTILGERTGSYNKQQPVEFLPPTMEISQQATSDGDPPLSSMPNSLFSLCSSNNCSQDPSPGQWVAWDSLAWTNSQWPSSRFQVKECLSQASEGLKNEPKPLSCATPESLVLTQDNMLLPGLFRDLELKLQWDYEQDENTAVS
ncbi:interleukin-22 receptor subunit alpha-1 [Eublepharis macularius]|uniref:Interleukin-22 receptor subunit alpha-1 n=1 Tax=Eublepharis macularius TaxID=481883 RepID=A0AA97LH18_EUBMA|nr:interleukin-22 receptor subunit alpha-1 [Eublepharis macularius]